EADGCADVLDHPLGLPVELHRHPRALLGEAVERHHSGVLGLAGHAGPSDALVRRLLGDLRRELTLGAVDVDLPLERLVIELADRLDEAQELPERLELRPLVVRGRDIHVDIDGLGDAGHDSPSSRRAGEPVSPPDSAGWQGVVSYGEVDYQRAAAAAPINP